MNLLNYLSISININIKYMSRKLTLDFIKTKTNNSKCNQIKSLNLWGNELEDISILSELPQLEIVSLNDNNIRNLEVFQNHENLKELYLRKNFIATLEQIKYLEKCKNLSILILKDNPITSILDYKNKIIEILPQLKKLDDEVIDPNYINKNNKSAMSKKNSINSPNNKKDIKKTTINSRESIGLDNSQNPFDKNMQSESNIKDNNNKDNIKEKDKDIDKEKNKEETSNLMKAINESLNIVNSTENKIKKLEKEDVKTSKSISNFKEFVKKNKGPFKKKEIKFEFEEKRNKRIPVLEKIDSHNKLIQSYSVADFNILKTHYQKKIIPNFKKELSIKSETPENFNNQNKENKYITSNVNKQINNHYMNNNNRNTVIQSIKLLLSTIDNQGLEELKKEIEKLLLWNKNK